MCSTVYDWVDNGTLEYSPELGLMSFNLAFYALVWIFVDMPTSQTSDDCVVDGMKDRFNLMIRKGIFYWLFFVILLILGITAMSFI